MSDYRITPDGELHHSDELKHYGVIGMKWGVRRNPKRAYERASNKMAKLNNKADKAKIKYGKKSGTHLTDFGVAAEKKARKRAARADAKAIKWRRDMDKVFSETKLSSLEKKYVEKGAVYVNKMSATSDLKKQKAYADKVAKNYDKWNDIKDLKEKLHKKD